MTCSYCRYPNSDEQNRCRRCGRPLRDVYAIPTTGALAAVPQPVREPVPAAAMAAIARPIAATPRQPSLFQERSTGNVIAFDGVIEPPAPKPKPATRPPAQPRRPATQNGAQHSLEFLQTAPPTPRKLSTTVEAVIDCDAPVAQPMHRACAAAIDGAMVVIAYGVFLTTFHLLGGSLASSKTDTIIMAMAAVLIAMFYGFIWVCAGRNTPGMRALSLTVINFDGYPPNSASRWWRYVGACLSYCAGGLGLLWALLDEESLAWHDHISKTFPTFRGPETSFVRRR
ncbi:MAG TPA: RDD family protein [Bryobacteraceae bacterium]|nr:RDD family protein [Bryobacteraceae bacterium]